MKFWLRSPLFEEAGDGNQGGGDGAGAGNSGAFDPAAFETKILGEIDSRLNKTINGFGKSFKNDIQKMFDGLKPSAGASSGSGSGSGDGAGAGSGAGDGAGAGKGGDPEKNALQLQIKKLQQESDLRIRALEEKNQASETRAQEMERDGALRDALGKFDFMSPEAKGTAFQIFKPQLQRTDDGAFVAGDLPLDKFLDNELPSKHAYLIKAKEVGGAGGRSGKPGAGGGRKWDVANDLKPENFSKLTPQQQAELRAYIAQN